MTSGEGLSVRGLTTAFPTRNGRAVTVDRVDLDVRPGEVVGLVGESGSGKSMTLRSIVRLVHEPGKVEGQVFWQGRDVMAVPGSVLSGRNRGSHGLLKDGAKVVESADDILEELGWPGAVRTPYSSAKSLQIDPLLARMEPGEVYRLDELIELTGMVGPKLLPRLMELELQGRVTRAGSGGFSRTAGPP